MQDFDSLPKNERELSAPPSVADDNPASGESLEAEIDNLDITAMLEKRAHPRVTVELKAELILNADTQECTTADLSAGGVKLKLSNSIFKNVRVKIANAGEFTGEIIWKDGDYIGIEFAEDQSEIINAMARATS